MKRVVLAASTLIGVASFAPVTLAQTEGFAVQSRAPQVDSANVTSSRTTVLERAPALEGVRPAAGMFPQQTGPSRNAAGNASDAPATGSDIRSRLRRD